MSKVSTRLDVGLPTFEDERIGYRKIDRSSNLLNDVSMQDASIIADVFNNHSAARSNDQMGNIHIRR